MQRYGFYSTPPRFFSFFFDFNSSSSKRIKERVAFMPYMRKWHNLGQHCAISKCGSTISYFSVLSSNAVAQFRTFLCYLRTRWHNLVLFCSIFGCGGTISYFSVLSPDAVAQFRTFLCYLRTRKHNLVLFCSISERGSTISYLIVQFPNSRKMHYVFPMNSLGVSPVIFLKRRVK